MTDSDSAPQSTPRGSAFNLFAWIQQHQDSFTPPVSNRQVWRSADLIFMIVSGPNARSDFHIDPYDEIFMQLRGSIRVDLLVDGQVEPRWVHEGEIMLVPAFVAHSPHRPPDTWGLVIERPRGPDDLDEVVWYCETCAAEVHRVRFHLNDIETELGGALALWNDNVGVRVCPNGHGNPAPAQFEISPPD